MKKETFWKLFFTTTFAFLIGTASYSQKYSHAGEYMDAVNKEVRAIMEEQMSYTSAVAHGKSAQKADKKRTVLLETSRLAQIRIKKMSGYDGDNTLRDSVLSYLALSYIVMSEDYAKIVDMEDIAEQSYDDMEAYLLAQEVANKKLEDAGKRLDETYSTFASNNNININENNKDELSKKLELTGATIKHYNTVYLIFFKANKQEVYLLDAMSRNDINAIEQNRISLGLVADEGLSKLKSVKSFRGDMSLITNCKLALQFYKKEAEQQIAPFTNFLMKKEKVDKMRMALEAKKPNQRTNEEITAFNNAIDELNALTTESNKTNEQLNVKRAQIINKWTNGVETFMAKHVPKYK